VAGGASSHFEMYVTGADRSAEREWLVYLLLAFLLFSLGIYETLYVKYKLWRDIILKSWGKSFFSDLSSCIEGAKSIVWTLCTKVC
jgi:hypothetical protein